MNSIFAESTAQLESLINDSTEKLKTLEEKVEAEMEKLGGIGNE